MGSIEYEDDDRALVHTGDVADPVARLYRFSDGWHAKLAHIHTGKGWFGPYESAEQALLALV
jgi:hypothetical protein